VFHEQLGILAVQRHPVNGGLVLIFLLVSSWHDHSDEESRGERRDEDD
jgi:hypothetical protein